MSSSEEHSVIHVTRELIEGHWEIKDFLDLPDGADYTVISPPFMFANAKWNLEMFPNGNSKFKSSLASLHLNKLDSSPKVLINITLGLKKEDGSLFMSFSHKFLFKNKRSEFGIYNLFQRYQLLDNDVVPNGVLKVFYRICIPNDFDGGVFGVETAAQTSPLESIDTLQRNFKDLLLDERHADVIIEVESKVLRAHWPILAARSTVFSAMYQHDTAEKQTGIVKITDCSPDSFKDFLSFLYTGNLDIVTLSNAVELYKTADKYNIQDLKKECTTCMENEFAVESICDVIHLAAIYNESHLLDEATNFFIKNSKEILKTPKWLSFLNDNSILANELFVKMASECKFDE